MSDRHKGVNKWLREAEPGTKHYLVFGMVEGQTPKRCKKEVKRKDLKSLEHGKKEVENTLNGVPKTLVFAFKR